MSEKTYDQRVREIAEEMAQITDPFIFRTNMLKGLPIWESAIDKLIPLARIAVKHMAEEFECGYNYACTPCDDPENGGPYIIFGQEERGLIPTPEQRKEAREI